MYRLIFLLVLVIASAVWAQDDASEAERETQSAAESVEATSEELDEAILDSQGDHTEEDEDVFKPTDVVSYEQSVPFPVDI